MDFLAELNQEQRAAALAPPGSWLVLAGPGTGKTRTLVARIHALIERFAIRGERILAVTYTNKASEQMRERLEASIGKRAKGLQIGTFHSFCVNLLRNCHEQAGLQRHFTVADEDRQIRLVARVAPQLAGERHARHLLTRFSEVRLNPLESRPLSALETQFHRRYKQELKKNGLIDFDDILFLCKQLLFEHPSILNYYRRRFDAVLIDEFQDTDRVQYEILRMLVAEHRNIFAVADDDQSIFSWRGASPQNIDLFRQDFASDNVIVLTENYRSMPEIVKQASSLISQNTRFKGKRLHASRSDSTGLESVAVRQFSTDKEEADFIVSEIRRQIEYSAKYLGKTLQYSDFAVLYPRHSVGEYLEREMMKQDMPCQLVRGKSVFDQPEIVRTINLLRILYNSRDSLALEDFVASEVDEVTFSRLKTIQTEESLDFRQSLDRFIKSSWIPEQERSQISRCVALITDLFHYKDSQDRRLSDLFAEIISSLSRKQAASLAKHIDSLTDPLFYDQMAQAARAFAEAVSSCTPVIIATPDERVSLLAIEMLHRVSGVRARSLEDFIAEQLSDKSLEEPLLIALNGEELLYAVNTVRLCKRVIYLGADYSPQVRELLRSVDALIVNPEQLSVAERGFEPAASALLFKFCQAVTSLTFAEFLPDYTAIDIETTEKDPEKADIVEIAAVRVRQGAPVEYFHRLIKPERPIDPEAGLIHGITDEDLLNAPLFSEIAEEFLTFVGTDTLVAHNGYNFDFPVLNRRLKAAGKQRLGKRVFDTLPMASRIFPDRSSSLDALAQAFRVDTGKRHRAYDDTLTLIEIFERLKKEHASRQRRTCCEHSLDLVAAAMLAEQGTLADPNCALIREGLVRLAASPTLERLCGSEITGLRALLDQVRAEQFKEGAVSSQLSAFVSFEDLISRFERDENGYRSIDRSLQEFLDFISLYQQQDDLKSRNAVHLMTIYASKGLEFPIVFIAGLEQNMLPSFYAVESRDPEQLAEQRRLFYVAITRAKDRLILTSVNARNGYPQEASEFLSELSVR